MSFSPLCSNSSGGWFRNNLELRHVAVTHIHLNRAFIQLAFAKLLPQPLLLLFARSASLFRNHRQLHKRVTIQQPGWPILSRIFGDGFVGHQH